MTVLLGLTASRVDVKGIVTCVTVLITPEGNLIVNPTKEEEQKARDKIPEFAYVTVMKIMKDDHVSFLLLNSFQTLSSGSLVGCGRSSESFPSKQSYVESRSRSFESLSSYGRDRPKVDRK